MRNLLLYTTLVFAFVSVLSGIFISQSTFTQDISTASLSEARWALITIMPVVFMVNFVWLRSTPTKGKIDTSLQMFGQTALFIAPFYWLFNHA
ncbi:hypothetical protein [uncultured Halopseudomonas sp.]|uniref:hypothetical protein n=1 Tax=uncultured Halopseudomonas sp. TaxID=2901193 RepID=UPI0030EF642F|tara:strand:- start:1142 stop:1420 length:279 start_codon:yes stop_codon:yes gene_type:complete